MIFSYCLRHYNKKMFIKTKFRCHFSCRGFEIITEEFTKDGLAVPTFKEEVGGVTAIIKREIFQAIQLGSRGNSKQDDPKNNPNNEPETRSSIAKNWESRKVL